MREQDNTYLNNRSRISIGKMLDHAVHRLHQNPDAFFALFIACGLASSFESKDVQLITGTSGIELSYEVMRRCGLRFDRVAPRLASGQSREYYAGHALASAQIDTGLAYEELLEIIPISGIISMYEKYHDKSVSDLPWQMDENERKLQIEAIKNSFSIELEKMLIRSENKTKKETHLRRMRRVNGLSQSGLAAKSGIPVRTIQQYEQRQKDINKASFEYIIALSQALNCTPQDLAEQDSRR